jgi:hypothetical protein
MTMPNENTEILLREIYSCKNHLVVGKQVTPSKNQYEMPNQDLNIIKNLPNEISLTWIEFFLCSLWHGSYPINLTSWIELL